MAEILRDLSDRAALLAALDANMAERTGLNERFSGGSKILRRPDCFQSIGELNHPIANQVFLARFSHEEVDRRIDETLAPYIERNLPCHWWIGCTSAPDDLAARLERRGFRHFEAETGMAALLAEMDLDPQIPEGVTILKVVDQASLDLFFEAFSRNGLPSPLARQIYELYKSLGFGDDRPMHQFVALLQGEPVATAAALYAHGVVGLYNVGTHTSARRRGIGTAVSAAAFAEAPARGYKVAIVVATPMGRSVYERLGAREVCKLAIYERPAELP
jgi:ribosomal protein S18 acetylase RimI-like enzyme